jgi:hypothetical protein
MEISSPLKWKFKQKVCLSSYHQVLCSFRFLGWIGVGWHAAGTEDKGMSEADIVIGYFDANGTVSSPSTNVF